MVAVLLVLSATAGMAQDSTARERASRTESIPTLSRELIQTLPDIRALGAPPPVPQVGLEVRVNGGTAMVPVTAALGLVDAQLLQWQLESVFPVSQMYYPLDSLAQVHQQRAAAWAHRLNAVPSTEQPHAVLGWQRVPLAELMARASNDTAARRLFDTRIAELRGNPVQQSYALFEVIATLADPTQDSARLARNVAVAESYLQTLQAVPRRGYATRHDSISVLERQWDAEDTLVVAYDALGDSARMLAHARRAITYATSFDLDQCGVRLSSSYLRVVRALMSTQVGRAQIAAFATSLLAVAQRMSTELPATATDEQRQRARQLESDERRLIEEIASWLGLLNTQAPAISAQAWFNTADSTYDPTPRTRSWADGRVHVLMFGYFFDDTKLSVLDRIQRHFPTGVEATFVTTTSGYAGPDLLGPSDEVHWLSRYLLGLRHLTMPIAVWAGKKARTGFVPEGHYVVMRPIPTPNETPFQAGMLGSLGKVGAILIDRQGIIRFFQDASTRRREAALYRRIQSMLDETAPTSDPVASTSVATSPRMSSVLQDDL